MEFGFDGEKYRQASAIGWIRSASPSSRQDKNATNFTDSGVTGIVNIQMFF